MSIPRGTTITFSSSGQVRGKPRPAVVVQDEDFEFVDTIIVIPLTARVAGDLASAIIIEPDDTNGLHERSSVMTQRMGAIMKSEVGTMIGRLSTQDLARIDVSLMAVLGLGKN